MKENDLISCFNRKLQVQRSDIGLVFKDVKLSR